jgi:hypothetical protein
LEKYRVVGEKLAVKGLDSFAFLCLCLLFFLLLIVLFCLVIIVEETNQESGVQFAILFTFFLFGIAQFFMIKAFLQKRKKIVVFNKKRGAVEFYLGSRYKKISVGKVSHWLIQTVLIKSNKGGIYQHHAILVGHGGRVYIGLSAYTKTGLKRKLRRINSYFQLGFKESENIIGSLEVIKQQKLLGGF